MPGARACTSTGWTGWAPSSNSRSCSARSCSARRPRDVPVPRATRSAAVADGEREARLLLRRLGVAPGALVARAYLDLLLDAPGIGDPGH